MITLLPDQVEVKHELRDKIKAGYKRPLVVAPCGWGKGTVSGDMIFDAVAKNNRVIFIVNRRELVKDMSKRLKALGIYHGILMGRESHGMHMPVLIASKDTLKNRLINIPAPDLVFVDEAHMFTSDADKELFDTLEENGVKCIIFLTATPWLLNGKGMEQICDCIIEGPQVDWLISQGRLAKPEIYSTGQPDMSKVHLNTSGDYDEGETAEVMLNDKLIGDMVAHWKELANGLRTIGFAVNVRAAEQYAEMFRAAGISSISVDAKTPDKDRHKADGTIQLGRDTIWDKLRAKDILVVWSVGIVSYGWDVPEVEAAIDAAPTLSLSKHLQRIQRPGRKHPGKTLYVILDHAGNTIRRFPDGSNGIPDSPRHWSLKGWKKKRGLSWKEEQAEINDMPLVCPVFGVNADTFIECKAPKKVLDPGTKECPVCGYKFFESSGRGGDREVEIDVTGKLEKVESRVYIYPEATGDTQRDSVINIAKAKGYKPGWIEYKTKDINKAREEYRQRFQAEPKDHWTAGMLKSMLRQADEQPTLAQVEEKGLENWLAGKD